MLRVNEIFLSYQGEGYHVGVPMVFVRFAGCNLDCHYCDTDTSKYEELTPEQVLESITEVRANLTTWISITGGEPLVQNPEELASLINLLDREGFRVLLETNGTLGDKLLAVAYHVDYPAHLLVSMDAKITENKLTEQIDFIQVVDKLGCELIIKSVISTDMASDSAVSGVLHDYLVHLLAGYHENNNVLVALTPVTSNGKIETISPDKLDNLYTQAKTAVSTTHCGNCEVRIVPQMHVAFAIR